MNYYTYINKIIIKNNIPDFFVPCCKQCALNKAALGNHLPQSEQLNFFTSQVHFGL